MDEAFGLEPDEEVEDTLPLPSPPPLPPPPDTPPPPPPPAPVKTVLEMVKQKKFMAGVKAAKEAQDKEEREKMEELDTAKKLAWIHDAAAAFHELSCLEVEVSNSGATMRRLTGVEVGVVILMVEVFLTGKGGAGVEIRYKRDRSNFFDQAAFNDEMADILLKHPKEAP